MKTTILMAGLLAALAGGAVLAQSAPEPGTTEPTQAAPGQTAPGEAPDMDMAGPGPHGGMMGLPGLAPLESYDADGDGSVTQEEIEAGRTRRFAEADADGDGALSPAELLAMEEAIREEIRLAQATQVVTRMDDNGDGLLQAEELAARSPQVAPIFDRLDADNDGAITQEEMAEGRPGRGGDGFGRMGHGEGRGHGGRGWGFMSGLMGD